MPARTKSIRQKEQEKMDNETSRIASIAEKHANDVIMSEKTQFEQEEQTASQELQQGAKDTQRTPFQQAVRYAVITVFSSALGIVFSSVLFNYPVSIGGGMLAFAPVNLQMATISLETEQNFFQANEEITVDIFIETKIKELSEVELAVQFDAATLEFQAFEAVRGFGESDIEKIDEKNGKINLSLTEMEAAIFGEKQKIGQLIFQGVATTDSGEVAVIIPESSVAANFVSDGVPGKVNLLKKTKNAKFSVIEESGKKIGCGKLSDKLESADITRENWDKVLLETKLPKDALVWQEAGNEIFFICATNRADTKKQLHILVRKNSELKKLELLYDGNKIKSSKEDAWQEEDGMLHSFSYDLSMNPEIEEGGRISDLLLRFDGESSWPKKGLAEIEL